jgi:hypothetical protein
MQDFNTEEILLKNIENLSIPKVKILYREKEDQRNFVSSNLGLSNKQQSFKKSIFYTEKKCTKENLTSLSKNLSKILKKETIFPCTLKKFNLLKKENFRQKKTIFKNKNICIKFQILD